MASKDITNNGEEKAKKSGFRDTIDSIIVAFVIAMILKAFIIGSYKIPSGSMLDTLLIGDHILVNELAYLFSDPKVGDVVVFKYPLEPDKDYIKRVIGAPGDKIRLEDKKLYRNGELIKEDYVRLDSDIILPGDMSVRDNIEEFTVPKDSYFVMGDNRDSSFDARFWGFVDRGQFVGKAMIIYWSSNPDPDGDSRFNRIGKIIR